MCVCVYIYIYIYIYKTKVKFTLEQTMKTHRRSRGIALLFNLDASATPRPLYPRERDPVRIVCDARWAPESVWTGMENFAPAGIRPQTVQPLATRYPGQHTYVYRLAQSHLILDV